ncbi:MAG: hypothetical protein MK299_12830, partial [Pseudomonadales bacterium]|nr:hypothetical protein [Pseudomonadales bacterium]
MRNALVSNLVGLSAVLALTSLLPAGVAAQSGVEFFSHEVRPIMERTCWNCHSDQIQSSGLDLSTREGALLGGLRGPAIVPGNAADSLLFRQVAGMEGPAMPLGIPLTEEEIEVFRTWINEGAEWDARPATTASGDGFTAFATVVPDSARQYWAFKLPEKQPLPDISSFDHPIAR